MKGRGANASGRSEGTRPERRVRQALLQIGLHYRINFKGVPGTPDIAFPRAKTAVLVHGCFWHVHPECAARNLRGLNGDNGVRSSPATSFVTGETSQRSKCRGWQVLIIWECECGNMCELRNRLRKFLNARRRGEG